MKRAELEWQLREDAWNAGYEAFMIGEAKDGIPTYAMEIQRIEWNAGFDRAMEEFGND